MAKGERGGREVERERGEGGSEKGRELSGIQGVRGNGGREKEKEREWREDKVTITQEIFTVQRTNFKMKLVSNKLISGITFCLV